MLTDFPGQFPNFAPTPQIRDVPFGIRYRCLRVLPEKPNAGSELIVDAQVVAAAVEAGGGIVLTSDTTDLGRLAAPYRNVQVVDIT